MASYSFPRTVNSTTYTLTAGDSYYKTRQNGPVLGIVLHVTAGLQDLDLVGTDGSAEGTAKWAIGRDVSWHVGVDSDSIRPTLPSSYTGWHAKGYNSRTVGIEISNMDARWDNKPAEWVTRTLRNAAKACAAYVEQFGLPLALASKSQVDSAIAGGRKFGFTYHSYLSNIRVDPGKTFPWVRFIAMVKEELGKSPAPLPTTAAQYYCYRGDTGAAVVRVQKIVGVTADGSFGPGTEAAVKKWQAAHKILADGKWGPTTEATYQKTLVKPPTTTTPPPTTAPKPGTLAVDGSFGPATTRRFQQYLKTAYKSGIVVDGSWGPSSRKYLEYALNYEAKKKGWQQKAVTGTTQPGRTTPHTALFRWLVGMNPTAGSWDTNTTKALQRFLNARL